MQQQAFEIEDLEFDVAPGGSSEPVIWIIGVMVGILIAEE